jgi:hypothetical protein
VWIAFRAPSFSVLDGTPADEIKHHHRVRKHQQRGEEAERDVARDVGAGQAEDGGATRPRRALAVNKA